MLISFSVSNYRSFGEEVTLNMVASNKITDHPNHRVAIGNTGKHVLRAAVIYGANGSGKSNLVRAMAAAQSLLRDGWISTEPFRFRSGGDIGPSSFEFRFLLGDHVFVYGFDVLIDRFVSEWLLVVSSGGREVPLFERNERGETRTADAPDQLFPGDPQIANALGVLRKLPLRPNQLFLNRVGSLPEEAQGPTLASVLRWLTQDLTVLSAGPRVTNIVERLHCDESFRQFCAGFVGTAGTGVGGLDIEETNIDKSRFSAPAFPVHGKDINVFENPEDPNRLTMRRLVARHTIRGHDYTLPFGEESEGTRQLLHLLQVLAPLNRQNRVVVIDELDRSLHPLLCWEFVRFFSETCSGAQRQLIVTTHNVHLLSQDLLRRDEYWFIEKDATQQSRLASLTEYRVRNDLQIEKGYLQGRFGAVPILGPMDELKRLLECPAGEIADAAQETPA